MQINFFWNISNFQLQCSMDICVLNNAVIENLLRPRAYSAKGHGKKIAVNLR